MWVTMAADWAESASLLNGHVYQGRTAAMSSMFDALYAASALARANCIYHNCQNSKMLHERHVRDKHSPASNSP
jgi:hypothetical protein